MHIAVVGATGVLGRSVVSLLLERGHYVNALVRNLERSNLPAHENLALFPADILDAESLVSGVRGCEAVMHLATAVPRPGGPQDGRRNDEIRTLGTRNLLQVATAAKARRYIQQSIVMLYAGAGSKWITEDSPVAPTPVTVSAWHMEEQVRASGLDWVVLRGGVFYGPGTARMFEWNGLALGGRLSMPGEGRDYVSFIHVEDMAAAVIAAAETPERGLTLNIVDDEPVIYRELFQFVAELHHAPAPATGGPSNFPSLRVSNGLAKALLRWSPGIANYRVGWIKGMAPSDCESAPNFDPTSMTV